MKLTGIKKTKEAIVAYLNKGDANPNTMIKINDVKPYLERELPFGCYEAIFVVYGRPKLFVWVTYNGETKKWNYIVYSKWSGVKEVN